MRRGLACCLLLAPHAPTFPIIGRADAVRVKLRDLGHALLTSLAGRPLVPFERLEAMYIDPNVLVAVIVHASEPTLRVDVARLGRLHQLDLGLLERFSCVHPLMSRRCLVAPRLRHLQVYLANGEIGRQVALLARQTQILQRQDPVMRERPVRPVGVGVCEAEVVPDHGRGCGSVVRPTRRMGSWQACGCIHCVFITSALNDS